MILPDRVFGSPGVKWMRSGLAMAPISRVTDFMMSSFTASVGSTPFFSVT